MGEVFLFVIPLHEEIYSKFYFTVATSVCPQCIYDEKRKVQIINIICSLMNHNSDIVPETQTHASDMPNRSQPNTDFNIDEIPNENPLDASLAPKLPTDMPTESDFQKRLKEAERILDEPESEDDLRRRIETEPEEMRERNKRRDD